jgi:hypothetical protein
MSNVWEQITKDARAGLVAAGYSPAVAVNVLKDVRRFARDTGTVLASVTRHPLSGGVLSTPEGPR